MDKVIKTMWVSFFGNTFLALMKLFAGFIGKSGALIADGIHSFSDLSTDLVAMVGRKLSKKPADKKHPYGHGKIEYLTSLFISIVILFLGCSVILNAFQMKSEIPSLYVALISFLAILLKYLLSSYVLKVGKKEQNNILIASGYESRSDVLSSIVVFFSVLCMQLSNSFPILKYSDIIAMMIVGLLIIKIGLELFVENLSLIIESQITDPKYLSQLKEVILKTKEIHNIDHLTVLKYGSYLKIDAEVSMNPSISLQKSHRLIHEAQNNLQKLDSKIKYVHIHVNPEENEKLIPATTKNKKQIEYFFEQLNQKDSPIDFNRLFMITVDQKIIGILEMEKKDSEIEIMKIYIDEMFRNCNIATHILERLEKANPNHTLIMNIEPENKEAIKWALNIGFQRKNKEEKLFYKKKNS